MNITVDEYNLYINRFVELLFVLQEPGSQQGLYSFGSVQPYPVTYTRGGILGNYTNPFFILSPNRLAEFKARANLLIEYPNQFDQYLFVSDGENVGSTTQAFQSTLSIYARQCGKGSAFQHGELWREWATRRFYHNAVPRRHGRTARLESIVPPRWVAGCNILLVRRQ